MSSWAKFLLLTAINAGISALQLVVSEEAGNLTPAQQTAVNNALEANQAVATAFGV